MLAEERHQIILRYLQKKHIVKVQDLVNLLNASESTVRRDLQDLEAMNLLRRVHGGASLLQRRSEEPDMDTKTLKNVQQKRIIAQLAAKMVKDNDCIYLDAGTTTLEMISYIEARNVIVVTNGLPHVEALVEKGILSYLLGGMMKRTTRAVIGSVAMQTLNGFRFDKAFLGANGVDPEMGFTTPDPEEALIKRRAKELSEQSFVLADSSKFQEVAFCKMFDISEAAIITEELPDAVKSTILNKTKVITREDSE
ncbi:DeoR family transcriptional regulator [Weizmannia acidilactici]|uniref:DeoR family transcriptional regulator n=1 Tax=Weizmannia acidilactici TaxID=2607726 RepID=A0A5J4JLH9_9BACI|nr:DeoR/GlpR family DNA-binding transcription regulator [Weizmannia acidilactici]GER67917.1 DeoR family transcriptional regulator [Weizmannia acidilactici]GER71555.1 DeoR family transcriptional regulator [Weizmannia acidilactici]GER73846.1 DeoR family transcriptional regulator [Weizmannia acidilactici]